MPFDEIVRIEEKIQTTTKLTVPQQRIQKQKQFRQWSQGKPMEFQKSNYKLPPNVAAAQQRRAPHSDAKNSINFGHFPNTKKDTTKYKTFGHQNPEKDQLAKEDKCFLCKKPGHVARDWPTRKVSSSYQQVNKKPMCKVETASLSVESDVDTSQRQVMRPPTDNRKAIIPVSQKILNAVEITINGHKEHALIDSCTINADLISANFCFLNKIPTEEMDAKPLKTAIKGSRSTMTKKANVELNIVIVL